MTTLFDDISYWSSLSMQINTCEKCQRNNFKLQKASGVLHPIPVKPKVWYQVGMDLIGPMPVTPRGNKYIVTLTDYFTKWAEAAPLPDKTALGVAKFIYSVREHRNYGTVVTKIYVCLGH